MNKRILELAKDHNIVRWDFDSLSYELCGDIENLYAFAEAIVQECASICYNSGLEDSDMHAQNLLYEFDIDGARNEK